MERGQHSVVEQNAWQQVERGCLFLAVLFTLKGGLVL